ncbi:MAG: hypothetical protein K6A23_14220 [Butyrivibrio sp.]|nr:hypothetical protein [Butyrivibrio sp.]
MRITNKIINNNSLYNINNNKVAEDTLNTMLSTGKKITRPSDDPVIAIRALRLRSNVSQLNQYYEKNAEDAESWLDVTEDSLSTITDILTDSIQQVNKGANKDLTIDDLNTIITQLKALSQEYYSTGNVDYAGRYIFTGYRTDTSLTYTENTTSNFYDINDESSPADVGTSKRVINVHELSADNVLDTTTTTSGTTYYSEVNSEIEIQEYTVGRIRLSYNNLDYTEGDGNIATLKFRENLTQPATSSITSTDLTVVNLTFTDEDGVEHTAYVPVSDDYTVTIPNSDGTSIRYESVFTGTEGTDGYYTVIGTALDEDGNDTSTTYEFTITSDGAISEVSDSVDEAIASLETTNISTMSYSDGTDTSTTIPLLGSIGQQYVINYTGSTSKAITVNSDGTYTFTSVLSSNATSEYPLSVTTDTSGNTVTTYNTISTSTVIQVTSNGSVHSSYTEYAMDIGDGNIIYSTTSEDEIDDYYVALSENTTSMVFNADTGELLLSDKLKNRLSTLKAIGNAENIDVIYDKKEWEDGDIRPQNLFACVDSDGIIYNGGSSASNMAYDVGYNQTIIVNTTADAVFSTDVKRDVEDLEAIMDKINELNTVLSTLNNKLESTNDEEEKYYIQIEIDASKKAYSYLREEIQELFENKITSTQKSLDTANIAVTDNGTRSKRLSLIQKRLQSQSTTFKTLQSQNEDSDMAEVATQLTTAQLTYQASLMATAKVAQTTLLNYL